MSGIGRSESSPTTIRNAIGLLALKPGLLLRYRRCEAIFPAWSPNRHRVLTMNLENARSDLVQALDEHAEPIAENRIRAARHILTMRGAEALGAECPTGRQLHDIIKIAAGATATPARRAFAILLVHALGVDGLVASRSHRGALDRDICAFVESALPTVLQRSGYPFGGETYEKRRSLDRLHAIIEELLRPLEPTFPPNVQGLYAG